MKILGIDPAKRSIGICVYDTTTDDYQIEEIKNPEEQYNILAKMPAEIRRYIDSTVTTIAIIEDHPFMQRSRGVFDRAEIVGVIKSVLTELEKPYILIGPTKWKSVIFGKGWRKYKKRTKAEKEEYMDLIEDKTGIRPIGTDAGDALCIVEWYRRTYKDIIEAIESKGE